VMKGNTWQKDGASVRTQYVNLTVARAKQVLPHIVAKLMTGASKQSVAAAAEKTTRETAKAATADITGHAGGHAAKVPFSVKDVKAGGALSKKSDEEILEM
jgi:ribosomal protein S3AE